MNKVKQIVYNSRGNGNTTWILESALINPNVIIVCLNRNLAYDLNCRYREIKKARDGKTVKGKVIKVLLKLNKYRILKSIVTKIVTVINKPMKEPMFVSVNDFTPRGYRWPVVFDNSVLS